MNTLDDKWQMLRKQFDGRPELVEVLKFVFHCGADAVLTMEGDADMSQEAFEALQEHLHHECRQAFIDYSIAIGVPPTKARRDDRERFGSELPQIPKTVN